MARARTSGRDIVVVGASAGGVEAMGTLAAGLPADLPAAVLVVLHLPATAPSLLPQILDRAGPLPARHAVDGERLRPGRIYVAPPDRQLVVEGDVVRLEHGARENNHRPAIDPLFRSAALAYRDRVVAVVLTGSLDDGSAGVRAVKRGGGVAVVQDPGDSPFPQMPESAIAADAPEHVVPLEQIAGVVASLVWEAPVMHRDGAGDDPDPADEGVPPAEGPRPSPSEPAAYGCPECGGVLLELGESEALRFRCRVGHAYSAESLDEAQERSLENALWTALRALEERADLARRVARRLGGVSVASRRERYLERARRADEDASLIREALHGRGPPVREEAAS